MMRIGADIVVCIPAYVTDSLSSTDRTAEMGVTCNFDDEDWCGYRDLYSGIPDWFRAHEYEGNARKQIYTY